VTIRVLIADDHPNFVRAVTMLLNNDRDIEVVATASDGQAAIDQALAYQPDVVLMDLDMPDLHGVTATKHLHEVAPHVAVVALTMFDDDDKVSAVMRGGAAGYLLKGARQDQIRRAVHAAYAGEAIFDAPIARRLKEVFSSERRAWAADAFPQLTDRERAVLDKMAAGLDNTAIAEALFLSEKTIRNYVSTIFAKLQTDSRAETIVAARRAGFGEHA
jgi:DNA-binding NarL/FixJ family response regulator